jgi:ABC-type multidrug transport system ATPase subunit
VVGVDPRLLRRRQSRVVNDDAGPDATGRSGRPTSSRRRARDLAREQQPAPDDDSTVDPDDAGPDRAPGHAAAATHRPAAIETLQLTKTYGPATALAPLDLRIEDGDRISLIGHNGSGKTTLLRMLVGLLEPSDGTATIGGHDIGSLEARAAVSYLADQPVFYDDLTVWEHLEYVARLHGTENWEQQAVDLVDMVGLTPRVDDLPATFSRGLRQKAAIAIAFVRPFDVMLIDEPFVGLDRTGRLALLDLLTLAHDDGATLVVATHELSSVERSSRLLALSDGEVVYDGPPAEADVAALSEGIRPDAR